MSIQIDAALIDERKPIKPARRPTFNRGCFEEAQTAAIRSSAATGDDTYMFPTAFGWKVQNIEPALPPGTIYFLYIAYFTKPDRWLIHAYKYRS